MKPTVLSRLGPCVLAALGLLGALAAPPAALAREQRDAGHPGGFVVLAKPQAPGSSQAARRRADERVARALDALLAAEHALRHGQQPLPGERRHLVDGYSRLTSAYFDRLQALQAAVDKARSRLQSAYAARDALTS
ncbi:MAG: hypothetical protein ABT20_15315 [Rubrivivax sp. SCN 70-15]|nr:MAG: hypothetical protein ABT20_15315 [Rubrivivax sp. SCN 70-15]